MFMQVIQGRVSDGDVIRSRLDAWHRDLGPDADGWLGTTAGVTADGEFIAVVRFSDPDAARRNSARPEQGEWWAETAKVFDGEAEFHDYPDTRLLMDGGSDDAGFVQVIQGTYSGEGSPADAVEGDDELADRRPDILGGAAGWNDDGHFTQTVYFTSEEAAREGERTMGDDPAVSQQMEEWRSVVTGMRFLDLSDPWTVSR